MIPCLVLTNWHGAIHTAIDFTGAKSTEPKLGHELIRIPLTESQARTPLNLLRMKHAKRIRALEEAINA